MLTLKGEKVFLRALEPEDLDFIFDLENDETIWNISANQAPYSKFVLKQYLDNVHKDIYEVKQIRLVISSFENKVIGLIDLFDFDPKNLRAAVGIIISDVENRSKGFGSEALSLLINYARTHLHLHQLYANISEDNIRSIKLFESKGFTLSGVKKEWNIVGESYKNELLYQYIYVH